MATDFRRGLNYGPVIDALLRKSREGKIDWRETADDEAFLTSVKGEMTFEVRRQEDFCELIVKDQRGRTVIRTTEPFYLPRRDWGPDDEEYEASTGETPVSALGALHSVARRVALRVDDRLETSLKLLESL